MAITDWPAEQRPREKLLARGAQALSDAELLAIFLRIGVAGKSAVALAQELLGKFGGLCGVFGAGRKDMRDVKGMGDSKYVQLQAVFEMAQRALGEELRSRDVLGSPEAVHDYLKLRLGGLQREVFQVLFLDAQNQVLAIEELFAGTLTQTSVHPRVVAQRALHHNAAAVILAHNHPSGVPEPSQADIALTRSMSAALALVEVRVLDHFIVAGNRTTSFSESRLL